MRSMEQTQMKTKGFLNPILNGDYPDPAVCRVGEDFYLTTSTGQHYPGLTIYHSKNLVDWVPVCSPLNNFEGDVWAPDLIYHQNKFYIYFSASKTNWVIWSDSIESGWSEAIDLKIGHIDPGHCVDDEGKRYLFLSGGCMVPLAADGLSVDGTIEQVMEPLPIPDEWEVEGFFPESPKITKRNGWYYLTYANGGTSGPATSHMVVSARAKNIRGPWEHSPYYPILRTTDRSEHWHSKGHGHLVDDIDGNWWILYHAYENGYSCQGRKLLMERIIWTEDDWFHTDESGSSEGNIVRPVGQVVTEKLDLSDDFLGNTCKLWKAWKDVYCTRYQKHMNGLCLDAKGDHPGESEPLTVTCGFHHYTVDTCITIEDGCRAGIILFYNDDYYNGIEIDGSMLRIYRIGRVLKKMSLTANRVYLRMVNRENYLSFAYSLDGMVYYKLNYVINVESQNNNAYGGFRALRPGIYACGNGKAVFSYFSLIDSSENQNSI